jgi:hypothetical protein
LTDTARANLFEEIIRATAVKSLVPIRTIT